MNPETDFTGSTAVKKKKRMPVWLTVILLIILFAGGVLAGLKLAAVQNTDGLWGKLFPESANPEIVEVTPAVTHGSKPSSAPTVKPAASAKPAVSSEPAASAKPEASVKPSDTPKQPDSVKSGKDGTAAAAGTDTAVEPEAGTKPGTGEESAASAAPEAAAASAANAETANVYIGVEAALDSALKHAKVDAKDAEVYAVYREKDDGLVLYEVLFAAGGREYEYEINALTGEIEGWKKSRAAVSPSEENSPRVDREAAAAATGSNLPKLTDAAKVKESVFKHAGVSAGDADNVRTTLGLDGLNLVYEIVFRAGGYEYEYEVNAVSGEIISFDKDRL